MTFNFIQQMFYVATATTKRPVETEITPRYSEEPSYSCQFHG